MNTCNSSRLYFHIYVHDMFIVVFKLQFGLMNYIDTHTINVLYYPYDEITWGI